MVMIMTRAPCSYYRMEWEVISEGVTCLHHWGHSPELQPSHQAEAHLGWVLWKEWPEINPSDYINTSTSFTHNNNNNKASYTQPVHLNVSPAFTWSGHKYKHILAKKKRLMIDSWYPPGWKLPVSHWPRTLGNPVVHRCVEKDVIKMLSSSQNAIFLRQSVAGDESRTNRFRVNNSLQASRFKLVWVLFAMLLCTGTCFFYKIEIILLLILLPESIICD